MTTDDALAALTSDPQRSAVVLDFDGVLAPIVDDPTASRMPGDVEEALRAVAARYGSVTILSGRPVSFLAEQVRVPGVRLLGSYGAETFEDGRAGVDGAVEEWLPAVVDATRTLQHRLDGEQGVFVEVKAVSVAVHWRNAPDRDAAESTVRLAVAETAAQTRLRPEPGKFVLELMPPVPMDKGYALRTLLAQQRPAAVAYLGDDLGDLPALEAVREAGGHGVVVRHGSETPQALLAVATATVEGTDGVAAFLRALTGA